MNNLSKPLLLFGTMFIFSTSVAAAAPYYIYQTFNTKHAQLNFKFDPTIDANGFHDIAGAGSYAFDSSSYVEAYYSPNASSPGSDFQLKWYGVNNTAVSWYGMTYHYNTPPLTDIGSGDYETKASIPFFRYSNYDEVKLNKYMMNKIDPSKQYETAAHEMGHVYGLHHDDYSKTTNPTIMMQYDWLGSNVPTWWDFSKINTLYQ